jgi:hypothetical protein
MKTKNTILAAAILAAGLFGFSPKVLAGASTTQTVTYEVQAINELAVSGSTASLTVNSATAGSAPNVANDTASTYSITTNETNRVITGSIDTNTPSGVTLSVTLGAPTGASSTGKQALSTVPVNLVTGIATLNESGKSIAYELAATSAAGVVSSASKTVTLTITAGS